MVTFNALSNLKNRAKSNFQRILRDLGEPVFIGDVPCQAIISDLTKSTNQLEDVREIETDYKFKRGDLVDWNNKKWFILSDIVEEHKHKYEGIMRPSNFSLSINVEGSNGTCLDWRRDGLGRPIECLRYDPNDLPREAFNKEVPALILDATYRVEGVQIRVDTGEINVIVQDNAENKEHFNRGSYSLKFGDSTYNIESRDFTKQGIITLICKA